MPFSPDVAVGSSQLAFVKPPDQTIFVIDIGLCKQQI